MRNLGQFVRCVLRIVIAFYGVSILSYGDNEGLRITSIPPGATIEHNGKLIGVTPHTIAYPAGYFSRPRTPSSRKLRNPLKLTFRSPGYPPRTIEVSRGPFVWINRYGQSQFTYHLLDHEYLIDFTETTPQIPDSPAPTEHSGFGTAFHCLKRGYLVTTHNLIDNASLILAYKGEAFCEASLVTEDSVNDLALLKLDKGCADVLEMTEPLMLADSRQVIQGQEVITYAYPSPTMFDERALVSRGMIKSTTGLSGKHQFTISNSLFEGNGGGPLVSRTGMVVGVIAGDMNHPDLLKKVGAIPQSANFAIPSQYVRELYVSGGLLLHEAGGRSTTSGVADSDGAAQEHDWPDLVELIKPNILMIETRVPCRASQSTTRFNLRDNDHGAVLSEHFEFIVNRAIIVDRTIGRIHVIAITAEISELSSGGYRLAFELKAENPEGHDQDVTARIELLDERCNVISSGDTMGDIEENESAELKLVIDVESPSPDTIKSFSLDMQAWDD